MIREIVDSKVVLVMIILQNFYILSLTPIHKAGKTNVLQRLLCIVYC